MKLLLDSHHSPKAAERLRDEGYDVTGAANDQLLATLSDEELLRSAARDVRYSLRWISQQGVQGGYELLRVAAAATVVAPGRGEDDAGVMLAGCRPRPDHAVDVPGVLGHKCPSILSCRPQ